MRKVLLALAVVVSVFPLWPIYQDVSFVIAVIGASVLAAVVAFVANRGSWKILRTIITSVIVFILCGVGLAVPSQALWGIIPTPAGLISLLAGTVLSWKELVTVAPPVGSYEALLVPPYILVFGGILVVSEISRRKKVSSWAPIVPLITLVVAIWLGPSRQMGAAVIALIVFMLVAWWFASARGSFAKSSLRAAGIIVVAGLIAAASALMIPVENRSVWRTQIEQPFVLQTDTSPLSEYRNYVVGDYQQTNLVSVKGVSAGNRVSLATLDAYNGVIYSVSGTSSDFTRVPSAISTSNMSGDPVTAQVVIEDLKGPWVPLPAVLGEIWFSGTAANSLADSFYYSRTADTGAVVTALQSGDTYQVTGVGIPELSLSEVSDLKPGTAAVPAPQVIPDGLDAFIALNSSANQSPAERLSSVLTALVDEGYVSHGQDDEAPSASGHGANRLASLFASEPMIGDAEQYASAAALIANQIGFPARVVMGFVAESDVDPAQTVTFTGEDMTAWIEISTSEGWMAINPNPELRPIPQEQPDDPNEVAFPQSAVEPPPAEQSKLDDAPVPEAAEEEEPETTDPTAQAILAAISVSSWVLLILGILASPLIAIAWLKRRRRRRRESASQNRDRVIGAWEQLHDVLVDHQKEITPQMTRNEIAETSGLPQVRLLADLGNHAQYARDAVSDRDADQAWREVNAVELELGASTSLWQRLRVKFSLRSLGLTRARLTAMLPWRR